MRGEIRISFVKQPVFRARELRIMKLATSLQPSRSQRALITSPSVVTHTQSLIRLGKEQHISDASLSAQRATWLRPFVPVNNSFRSGAIYGAAS
ncbi:MAG: hypothetical protein FJX40_14975 [Alphaproteobacteria bacterium]|nr:hypothetical protein [Alphaproteobacteria bacterium]